MISVIVTLVILAAALIVGLYRPYVGALIAMLPTKALAVMATSDRSRIQESGKGLLVGSLATSIALGAFWIGVRMKWPLPVSIALFLAVWGLAAWIGGKL